MIKRIFTWGLGIVLGLFILNVVYGRFVTAAALNSYEETFQTLEHPKSTTHIDAFKFKFWYYPATYRDESIQDQCVYLVGRSERIPMIGMQRKPSMKVKRLHMRIQMKSMWE